MKTKTTLLLILISLSLLFSGCFSDWKGDTGTITLNFDNNNRVVTKFPPVENPNPNTSDDREVLFDEIEYEIIFSGHNEEFTLKSKGKESVLAVVTPGRWEITVKAYIYETGANGPGTTVTERIMYAIGKENVRIKPGYRQAVTVKMTNMASVNVYIEYNEDNGGLTNYNVLKEYISYDIINVYKEETILSNVKGRGPHRIEIPSGETVFGVYVYLNGTKLDDFYGFTESIKINPGDNDVTIPCDFHIDGIEQTYYLINFEVDSKGNPFAYSDESEPTSTKRTWVSEGETIFIEPNPATDYEFNYNKSDIKIISPDISSLFPLTGPFIITSNKIEFTMPYLSNLQPPYSGASITIKIEYEPE
jgi:hypothetical protein